MSQSRADFLRSMGIDNSDLQTPPEPVLKPKRAGAHGGPAPQRNATGSQEYGGAPQQRSAYTPKDTNSGSYSSASSTPTKAAAPASAASASARADFLRSMGIENAGEGTVPPEPKPAVRGTQRTGGNAPPRNATGSQEYPATSTTPTMPMGRSFSGSGKKKMSLATRDDDDDDSLAGAGSSGGYGNPAYSAPSDLIRGKNMGPQAGPKNDALNAQLVGLAPNASADECKALGNKFFESGDYRKSIRLYAKAIDLDGSNAALYSNRSAAYLLGGKQMGIDTRNMSLRDADKAIKLRPTWYKGYSRRGDALFKKECFADAIEAYETALDLDPSNKSILHSLGECQQLAGNGRQQGDKSSWKQSSEKNGSKSAYEMLDEFNEQRDRETPKTSISGTSFREQQLEQFRKQKTPTTSGSYSSSYPGCDEAQASSGQPSYSSNASGNFHAGSGVYNAEGVEVQPGGGFAKGDQVPEEFNSRAAAAYQNSLLDAYRAKKAGKK